MDMQETASWTRPLPWLGSLSSSLESPGPINTCPTQAGRGASLTKPCCSPDLGTWEEAPCLGASALILPVL